MIAKSLVNITPSTPSLPHPLAHHLQQFADHHGGCAPDDVPVDGEIGYLAEEQLCVEPEVGEAAVARVEQFREGYFEYGLNFLGLRPKIGDVVDEPDVGLYQEVAHGDVQLGEGTQQLHLLPGYAHLFFGFAQGGGLEVGIGSFAFAAGKADLAAVAIVGVVVVALDEGEVPAVGFGEKQGQHARLAGVFRRRLRVLPHHVGHFILCRLPR